MHTRNSVLLLALLVALCEQPCMVHAQNTFTPDPIQHYYPSFWNDDVFAERVPAFALGHQWGAAKLDKVNSAFKMNVTSQNWGYLNAFAHEMYKLGRGINDTNYVVWSSPLWYTPGPYGNILRREWYGLRWEPCTHCVLL